MIIKKLELQGFKSFSDRTKILFHPGITAIIGPNGTGKSNIVDALLWSLRGRRLKAVRGDRSGDNIFNGNNEKPPMSMADVALILGDIKDKEKEDMIINHRLFRSGETEFRLNGKSVRLKDIQEALHKNAISDTEYYVIEQGSIGVFLSSKPMEKRVLLEEAAGTAYYKDKKRQAELKLENSEQNLIRLEDIIIEVEKATNSLKRQAQAAIRYRKLREHIRQLTLSLYRQKIQALEEGQKSTASQYRGRLDAENAILSQIKTEEQNLATTRKEVWAAETTIKEEKDKLYQLKSLLSKNEAEKEREEKRADYLKERQKEASKTKGELNQELKALSTEKSELAVSLTDLNADLNQKQKELEKAEQTHQTARQDIKSLEEGIEQLRETYFEKLSAQTEVKNDAAKIEKEIELILRQEHKLKTDLESQQELKTAKSEQIQLINTYLAEKKQSLQELKAKLEQNQIHLNEVSSELEALQNKLSGLKEEKDSHFHHLSALEKMKAQESQVEDATNLKSGLGILADLIESSAEHAVLIDVFYKEEAKATLIAADKLMAALQTNKPKGQFLLLHPEEQKLKASAVYSDSRVLGMLKSSFQADPKVKHHLSALKDAAIVKDMPTAIKLWIKYPKQNFITMDGDLLMSSGLTKMGQKKEGLFAVAQEIKKLKARIQKLEKEIVPIQDQVTENTSSRDRLETQTQEDEISFAQLNQEIEIVEKEQEYEEIEEQKIATHITLIENELSTLIQEKNDISEKEKELIKTLEKIKQEEDALKEQIKQKEDEFASTRGESEQSRKQFFELQSGIDLIKEKIQNNTTLENRLSQRADYIEEKIKNLSLEIRNAEKNTEDSQAKSRDISSQISKLEKESQQKEGQLTQDEANLSQMQKQLQDMEDIIQEHREKFEATKEERVKWEVSKAEKERDLVNLEESCWQELKKTLNEVKKEVELKPVDAAEVESEVNEAQEKLQRFKAVNLMAEEEYNAQKKRFDFLTKQQEDLKESIVSTKEAIKKIDQESKQQFLTALIAVNKNFQDVFSELFKGGSANVKLSDENNPLESGIEIIAQPPGKRVQSLNLLSGGERALTSLAFFFALFRYRPAPFCILDEVDAALDDTNLARFLDLMRNIKHQTQFIIITHNFKTMEVADYIYGTTMAEPNITTIYSVKIKDKLPESTESV